MEDISIDRNRLPGVREVCRDFAVLEDHCLAHNLQEQEIENHLASNVHKNRLVQQDLRVAKRLQEEEELRAKTESQKEHQDIERIDNEIAQEIQDQLVRQAEQQRKQEEKDEAIARKIQEREMKEEWKRQKQLEAKLEEQYYEERGDRRSPLDPQVQYPRTDSPVSSNERNRALNRGRSPDCRNQKLEQKRRLDSNGKHTKSLEYYPAEHSPSRPPEQNKSERNRGNYNYTEHGPLEHYETEHRSKNKDKSRRPEYYTSGTRAKYPEEFLTERNTYHDDEYLENRQGKKYPNKSEEPFRNEEQLYCDDSAYLHKEQNRKKDRNQERGREERKNGNRTKYPEKSQDRQLNRDTNRDKHKLKEVDQDTGQNGFTHKNRDMERERHCLKEKERIREKNCSRDKSRGREPESPTFPDSSKYWSEESKESTEYNTKQRYYCDEPSLRSHTKGQAHRDRGRHVQEKYGMREATEGIAQMDLRAQEIRDIEVARRIQQEEVKASKLDKRAAQVAQDEEIARRLMEEEEREFKRSREKEKQALERQHRRADGDFKAVHDEAIRPRTREQYDHQRARDSKPSRPPPHSNNYENVDSSYAYSDNYSPRPPPRPEAAYKGAYYRQ
ncbi:coiled-coil domain-containing protein 50 isoform X1 [Trichomycterus rosablanca]|uniref:coiled-coil domain-containing protein 50 isoform X1 n=1 Tax=Trichomycterus rosablanca TaxID=2290929 RepID=UPI002F35ECDE